MRYREVKHALRRIPFEPVRIVLDGGEYYDVPHPEFAQLTKQTLFVDIVSVDEEIPDTVVECDLSLIAAVELIDRKNKSDSGSA